MKNLLLIAFAALTLGPLYAQQQNPLDQAISTSVDKLLQEKKLAGAVTLVGRVDGIMHLQAHGVKSLESGDAMQTDTIFRIHSMTKAIVSAAALRLVDEGKLDLKAPVSQYLPRFKTATVLKGEEKVPAQETMLVEHLLLHTSGLAYSFTTQPPLQDYYTKRKLWSKSMANFSGQVSQLPLAHEPGTGWTYGISTDVLGAVVAVCAKKRLPEYLKETVFNPLKMKDTNFWIEDESNLDRFASVHKSTPEGVTGGSDPLSQ
ncbi:MAG: serine hydrolase domain-containing protein, partial [Verrucomicrobiota bacterium]